MRRRDILSLLGTAAVAWPLASRAQKPNGPLIGFLNSGSERAQKATTAAYRRGLQEEGFVDGTNVALEYRWGNGEYAQLPEMAAELVARKVAIVMAGGPPAALAAQKATATIPIVFTTGADPVKAGLVSSINRPGANVTGVFVLFAELQAKQLSLMREVLRKADLLAFLVNPGFPGVAAQTEDVREASEKVGTRIQIINATNVGEIDEAFAVMAKLRVDGLLVAADVLFSSQRERITALAAKYGIPAMYEQRSFAEVGGLMSYGPHLAEAYRQAGMYTGRILKGEKPSDLPILLSHTFEFVINLKAAKALGLAVPMNVLSTADDLIE